MNYSSLAKGIMCGLISMGVRIEKITDDKVFISIPKESCYYDKETDVYDADSFAKRLKEMLPLVRDGNRKLFYKIRDEHFTEKWGRN